MEVDDLKVAKQKLSRKITEIREELSRETSLRSSLEESHNSLLTRVKEMEVIVSKEREEVKESFLSQSPRGFCSHLEMSRRKDRKTREKHK